MVSKKAALLRTATNNLVTAPAPDRMLVNNEALNWPRQHGIVFHIIWLLSGEMQGFNQVGQDAIVEFTTIIRQENRKYQWGTDFTRLANALADAIISNVETVRDETIAPDHVATIESTVATWFSNETVPKTFLVPCSILPYHASPFSVGPALFISRDDLINRDKIANANE